MRVIFVRHGHPNYRDDCLTELGHLQAEAAAERLQNEGIQQIYASTCGRAMETAIHTAQKIGIDEIVSCDFMREIRWKSIDGTEIYMNGHPWYTADHMAANGQSIMDEAWMNKEPFCNNEVIYDVADKSAAFDELLGTLGYQREGLYYRINANTDKTIAVFSHAGSSSAVLGHLFNLPFPFMCSALPPNFTAVTIVTFSGENGALISPKIELFNDARHIETVENVFG